jgi:hypothetical protein
VWFASQSWSLAGGLIGSNLKMNFQTERPNPILDRSISRSQLISCWRTDRMKQIWPVAEFQFW